MTELNRLVAEVMQKHRVAEDEAIREMILKAGRDFDWESHFIHVITSIPEVLHGDQKIITSVCVQPLRDYPLMKRDLYTRVYHVTPETVEHVFRKADDDAGTEETNPR